MITRGINSVMQYLSYCLRAKSRFRVHSPFVYSFYTEVILGRTSRQSCIHVVKHRKNLYQQKNLLETTDFGAAVPKGYKTRVRRVCDIAKLSSVNEKHGKLLYRITSFRQPKEILEIGTAMGISTMYMACAAPLSRINTIEGCAMIAQKALDGFQKYKINNIELVQGNFDLYLPELLKKIKHIDMVFLDGNHKEKATLQYFELVKPKLHEGSIVLIDDIYWSAGMKRAWEQIIRDEDVSISIDLFKMGILFFRKDIAKEHFTLRF